MVNNQNNQYSEWDTEVAKRIACAVYAYQSGQAFEALWEQYSGQNSRQNSGQNEEIGTFWLSIAKQIRETLPYKAK
jgi:hypothetical protein